MFENFVLSICRSTPLITRYITFSFICVSVLLYCGIVSSGMLTFSRYYIFNCYQVHRLFSSFFYFGRVNLETVLHISFLYRYSKMLEDGFINSSDYFYFIAVIWLTICTIAYFLNMHVLGPVFAATITYIWTRKNPNAQVQMLGIVVFRAFYLPYVPAIVGLLTERKIPRDDIVGVLVGNSVFYAKYIMPRFGYDILKTPLVIKRLFGEDEPKRMLVVEREEND